MAGPALARSPRLPELAARRRPPSPSSLGPPRPTPTRNRAPILRQDLEASLDMLHHKEEEDEDVHKKASNVFIYMNKPAAAIRGRGLLTKEEEEEDLKRLYWKEKVIGHHRKRHLEALPINYKERTRLIAVAHQKHAKTCMEENDNSRKRCCVS